MHPPPVDAKQAVLDFWDRASCGEEAALRGPTREDYAAHARWRYAVEPFIPDFAEFERWADQRVLEIGVGLGADHQRFAEAGARLHGVDLTPRAIEHTSRRLTVCDLSSRLRVADAEALPYPDERFDLVYSWGVLHHSPDPPRAIKEVWRVLRPGGVARVMIYHRHSIVGRLLWTRYALLGLKPWTTLDQIYADRLESPGTKAYAIDEARRMFSAFQECGVQIRLSSGDLLEAHAGQRHRGALLGVAQRVWPRRIIRRWFPHAGLFMLIRAQK